MRGKEASETENELSRKIDNSVFGAQKGEDMRDRKNNTDGNSSVIPPGTWLCGIGLLWAGVHHTLCFHDQQPVRGHGRHLETAAVNPWGKHLAQKFRGGNAFHSHGLWSLCISHLLSFSAFLCSIDSPGAFSFFVWDDVFNTSAKNQKTPQSHRS